MIMYYKITHLACISCCDSDFMANYAEKSLLQSCPKLFLATL